MKKEYRTWNTAYESTAVFFMQKYEWAEDNAKDDLQKTSLPDK